jgi:glycosyltransferase involved in cell wall biosynthesis
MIRIAFITSDGMGFAGTQKFLQTVAVNLPKDKYEVDYYYIDSDKKNVSISKIKILQKANVNLIPYSVTDKGARYRYCFQRNSTFMSVYKGGYDVIFTGSNGLPEYPLTKIKDTPIIQTIHYVSGYDNQYNIARVVHISSFSKELWIKKGGDAKRCEMTSHPIQIPDYTHIDIRKKLGISNECFVFGMHQRDDDKIFSDVPLKAYSMIENDHNAFIICGGSKLYREQAKMLHIKNCYFLNETDNSDIIYSFLECLNVYAHGRYDGELNSTALAEAMYFGLPIVTHPSPMFNGHLEVIKDNGKVADSVEKYANYLMQYETDLSLYSNSSEAAKRMFSEKYDLDTQMQNIERIITETLENPYPHKFERAVRGINNDICNFLKEHLLQIYFKKQEAKKTAN